MSENDEATDYIDIDFDDGTQVRCEVQGVFDLDGEEWEIEGDDLLGRCLQHELDHLDGITMFERCDPMARIEALRDYEIALAAGARPGETSLEARVR